MNHDQATQPSNATPEQIAALGALWYEFGDLGLIRAINAAKEARYMCAVLKDDKDFAQFLRDNDKVRYYTLEQHPTPAKKGRRK